MDVQVPLAESMDAQLQPLQSWVGLFFFLFFFSIWNGVCSAFFYPSMQRLVNRDLWGIPLACGTCCLPHLPIGVIVPYMIGGIRFVLIAIWPYYVSLAAAISSRQSGEPLRSLRQATSEDQRPSLIAQSVAREIHRSHSSLVPSLRRIYSGGAAKFPERYRLAREQLAGDNAECAICFDALCVAPVCGLVDNDGRRQCSHFFHRDCIESLMNTSSRVCPLCRCPFAGKVRLPQAGENPETWFRFVNLSGSGALSPEELLSALKAVLPLGTKALEMKVREVFGTRSSLNYEDAVSKDDGIYAFIQNFWATAAMEESAPGTATAQAATPLHTEIADMKAVFADGDRRALFNAWDTNGSGRLDAAEVYRGCVRSLGSSPNTEAEVYQTYLEIDPTFGDRAGITYESFSCNGGLLDLLLERLGQHDLLSSSNIAARQVELQHMIGRTV